MKERPILFSGPMVRAILDGRKTMTRRVMKPQPEDYPYHHGLAVYRVAKKCPYGVPGDLLWVREKWRSVDFEYRDCMWSASIQYADGEKGPRVFWYDNSDVGIYDYCIYDKTGWRPSTHMPKEAARIFLRVTDVRVERVQDILCGDMQREGCIPKTVTGGQWQQWQHDYWIPLWDSINAKRGFGWDANPWVWVVGFEQVPQ